MKKYSGIIIFWGAVWGATEATLGYFLHEISFNIGWAIWFPLAFYFMNKVYMQTGRANSIFYTSCIAAGIKLIDLLMSVRIDKVLNPSVSILLEGIVIFAVYKIIEYKRMKVRLKYAGALAVSMAWRVLYIPYIFLLPPFFISISPISGVETFLRFMLLESIVNSLIVYLYIRISAKISNVDKVRRIAFHPAFSLIVLVLAIFVQWRF
jgi:hypothetical protein